jgi:hypothetical protein
MYVRNETTRMWQQYKSLFSTLNALGGGAAVLFAVGNGPFVELWTNGMMSWPGINNWLLAIWLVLLTQLCAHNSMLMVFRQVSILKYIYFGEALTFLALGLAVTGRTEFTGLILCSIVCTALFTFAYGSRTIAKAAGVPVHTVLYDWQLPFIRVMSVVVPVAVLIEFLVRDMSPMRQLLAGGGPLLLVVLLAVYKTLAQLNHPSLQRWFALLGRKS